MVSIIELIIVFVISIGANMVPFAGPSNLLIPTWFPNIIVGADIPTLVLVGVLVALGAALAKGSHYMITFFVSGKLSQKRRERLDKDRSKIKRWAFLLLFVAAATPIPDEPVVIPLGLLKYNPVKFTLAYFTGKLSIAIIGAFLGELSYQFLGGYLGQIVLVIISVVLTIAITVFLLKVDLSKIEEQTLKKLGWSKDS